MLIHQIRSLAIAQDGVITTAQCLQLGLRKSELRSLSATGRWLRVARGVYFIDADTCRELPERAKIRAALSAFGPSAVCVARTAAHVHGIDGIGLDRSGRQPTELGVPRSAARSRQLDLSGVRLHEWALNARDVTEVGGFPVTTVARTVADLILRLARFEAVSVLDSALNQGFLPDLAEIPALLTRRRGAVAARKYLMEADGRAQSPLETRTRLRCVDAGLPPGELQYPVRDEDGTLLGYADLAWPEARVIAEADGAAYHKLPEALLRDRRRQNDFANAGWTVLRFTWQDTLRAGYIPSVLRRALASQGR